jgi:RHS repeat-associated protein
LPSRSADGSVLSDRYAYDANANVASITDENGGAFTRTMTYDDLDRLKTARNDPRWGGTQTFGYDALDNLRSMIAPGFNWAWQYTAAQRLDRIDSGGSALIAYTYDARGRVATRTVASQPQLTFATDLADRVAQIGPNVATYRYDGHGRRTTVTKSGVTTVQVYSQAGQLLYQSAPASTNDGIFKDGFQQGDASYPPQTGGNKRYVYLGRHLIAEDGTAGRRYIHTDGLGSPALTTSTSGAASTRNDYRPYGWGPPAQSTPGFTGHVADAETGLSYMQARYYDPFAGRFLAVDPVAASEGSFNRYWYANNNPYKNIDPDGKWVCASAGKCGKFEQWLGMIKDASVSKKLSTEERRALSSVVKFFGENGETGVRIEMTNRGGSIRGSASLWGDGTININVEEKGEDRDRARHLAHEGSHGLDLRIKGRGPNSIEERMDTELNAYTTQAYFQKAVEYSGGIYDVWTLGDGVSQANIEKYARTSVIMACAGNTGGSCGSGD